MISKDIIYIFGANDISFCVILPFPTHDILSDLLVSHSVNSVIAECFIWLPDRTFRDGSKQAKALGMKEGKDNNQKCFPCLSVEGCELLAQDPSVLPWRKQA